MYSLVLFCKSSMLRLGPFLRGNYIRVELIRGLVLFLNELCVMAWSFFEQLTNI